MANVFYFEWEVALMEFIQAHLGNFGTALASFFTLFGQEAIMIAVLGFFYWAYDKKCGRYIGINIIAGAVVFPMVKNIFLRSRPYMDHTTIKCLKAVDPEADIYDIAAQGYAFPSGHSTNSMLTYGSVARYQKKKVITIIASIIIFCVGVSRFCVGVHYPTDVLCGWAIGLVLLFLMPWLSSKFKKEWHLYILMLVLGLPGFFYCTSNDFYTSYGMMIGAFAGFLFEEKYVHFENTRSILQSILRVVIGAGLFFGLNSALKLPFSSEFLESGTTLAFLVRTIRYALVIFYLIGAYPMLFKYFDRIGKKKN